MKPRAEDAPAPGIVISLPVAWRRPVAQARVIPIADTVAAISFDGAPEPLSTAQRLTATADGAPIGRPLISTSLDLRTGARRHLVMLRRAADDLVGRDLEVFLGGALAARLTPDWLLAPIGDTAEMFDGLTERAQLRLVKLVLTTGASLFGLAGSSEFDAAVGAMLDLLGVPTVSPASVCPLSGSGRILSYRLAGDLDPAAIGDLTVLAGGRATRLKAGGLTVEPVDGASVLHVHLPEPLPPRWSLIGLGAAPVRLGAPDAGLAAQPLAPWLERRSDATRQWAADLVARAALADPCAAALARELRHGAAAAPALEVRHLSTTPGGLLYALDVTDPHRLLRAVRIERGAARVDIELEAGATFPHPLVPIVGFAALAQQTEAAEICRLRLVFWSGRLLTVHEARPETFDGDFPRALAPAVRDRAIEPVALARLAMPPDAPAVDLEDFGAARTGHLLSVIAPVSENLDIIRARAARLFAEPDAGAVELVYHAPAGPLAMAARSAIADAQAVYGVAHRLVTLHGRADPTARLLAALAAGRGAAMLALGADVLPEGPGWLAHWLRALDAGRPIVGGAILAVDGSIVHAGARHAGGGRIGASRSAGLPARGLPRSEFVAAGALTADCVGLSRMAVDLICGAPRRYPDADVMLALAFDHLAEAGHAPRTLLRGRVVRYGEARGRDAHDLAADACALDHLRKSSFRLVGEEGAA